MNSLKCAILALPLLIIFAGPGSAAAQDIQVSPYDVADLTYPDLSDIEIPPVERVDFDNGLTVFLIEDHELPLVSAQARVGVGSVYVPKEMTGLASITGSVMRTGGTESWSSNEINQALENVGATVETFIGETSGGAYMTTLKEHMDEVLPIFVEVLTQPAFAEEKVELAKTQQSSSISRRNDNPQGVAFREFSQLLYGEDSPYARVEQYWTIDAIEREDVATFHDRFFHPNNTLLSVWGDFDTEEMVNTLRVAFGDWERAENFERPPLPPKTGEKQYSVHLVPKSDVTQSTVLMGYPGDITRRSPDYFPVIVMNQVLSGGFTSRLFQNVRSDQGLAYAVGGAYTAGYDQPGQFYALVMTKSGTTIEAAESVMHEIERLSEAPPTNEEVALAKDSYLNSFVFNFDTRREIVRRLMTYEYYDYPQDFLQQVKDGVENVTPQDVYVASQKYLHPDQLDLLVLGRQDDFGEPVATLAGGGEVDVIDITIRTEPPGQAVEENEAVADAPDGRELLLAAAEELGGLDAFKSITNIRTLSEQQAQTPMGDIAISIDALVSGPDRMRVVRETPMGTVVVVINEEGGQMQSPRGTQPLPASALATINSQLWYELGFLLARADREDLVVKDLGTTEIDGAALIHLSIEPPNAPRPFDLYLDPETHRPQRIVFEARNMRGQMQTTTQVYSEYGEAGPVMLPYQTITYVNDEVAATTTIQEIAINAELPEDAFAFEQ